MMYAMLHPYITFPPLLAFKFLGIDQHIIWEGVEFWLIDVVEVLFQQKCSEGCYYLKLKSKVERNRQVYLQLAHLQLQF